MTAGTGRLLFAQFLHKQKLSEILLIHNGCYLHKPWRIFVKICSFISLPHYFLLKMFHKITSWSLAHFTQNILCTVCFCIALVSPNFLQQIILYLTRFKLQQQIFTWKAVSVSAIKMNLPTFSMLCFTLSSLVTMVVLWFCITYDYC